jgi:hypothetical protein
MFAAHRGLTAIVQALIDAGADLGQQIEVSTPASSALMIACDRCALPQEVWCPLVLSFCAPEEKYIQFSSFKKKRMDGRRSCLLRTTVTRP